MGQDAPLVPGSTPGTTPPTFGQPDQSTQQLLQMLTQAMKPRTQLQNPTAPAPIPQQKSTMPPAGMKRGQANMYSIGSALSNAAAFEKQKQLTEAESDWNDLTTSIQKYMQPDGSIDPKAYQDPAVMNVLGNPKKLKKMAKALNQDWLNPKPDVYATALGTHLKKQQQKTQAAQGLKAMVSHLIQRGQQPQLDASQQQAVAKDVMSRAPISTPQQDPKQAMDLAKSYLEMAQAQKDMQQNYQVMGDAGGRLFAINKTNPKDIMPLTDSNGQPITAAPKVGMQPKVVSIGGVPYGVSREGKLLTPGDPGWTPADQEMFAGAQAAAAQSQQNKLSLADQVSKSRAMVYMASREYPVIDKDTGEETFASPAQINANPAKYAAASGGAAAMAKQAALGDIQFNIDNTREAIAGLKNGFDNKQRAQVALLLRSTDPRSAMSTFINSDIAKTLTPDQVDYITALASLQENAMALRSIAGMGQGSDDLRAAITRAIPGVGTPSAEYATRQLNLFQGTLDRLSKGVPKMGAAGGNDRVRVKSPNGKIGTIPKSQLPDALRSGYTQVQ